jgi:predicted permease
MTNLRYAFRQLRSAPGFALTVILTLGAGIGANLAIFQLLHAVLLAKLPVAAPEQLYSVHAVKSPFDAQWFFSYPAFKKLQTEASGAASLVARSGISEGLLKASAHSPERVRFQLVSSNFFDVLGVAPERGRFFNDSDDATSVSEIPVVLRAAYWQRAFGADPNIIGRKLIVNSVPVVVVGVAPEKFAGVVTGSAVDVWLPLAAQATGQFRTWFDSTGPGTGADISSSYLPQSNVYWLWLIARFPDPATQNAAASRWTQALQPDFAELAAISKDDRERTQVLQSNVQLISAAGGEGPFRNDYSPALLVLMAMAAVVLLVGCVNIANLQLARLLSRQRELSVRASLGANRWQLLRQLAAEGFLLAASGAILAVAIGQTASALLLRWTSSSGSSIDLNLESGSAFFGLGALLLLLALLACSVLPAWRMTRVDLSQSMTSRAASSSLGGPKARRWSSLLLAGQVSFSLLSVGTAAMFAQTLLSLSHVNAGLDRDRLITIRLDFSDSNVHENDLPALYARVLDRIRQIHGVTDAAVQMCAIPGCIWNTAIHVASRPDIPEKQMHGEENRVGAGYFHTMGIPLIAGREFDARDLPSSQRVAILSRAFSRQLFGDESPIGHRIGYSVAPADSEYLIVGEVEDARVDDLRSAAPAVAYFPLDQRPTFAGTIMVRAAGDPSALFASLRNELAAAEPDLPIESIAPLNVAYSEGLSREILLARLTGAFGILALGLAVLGFYGLLSFLVTRRTAEIGVRVAVGATPVDLYRLVLGRTFAILIAGIVPGLVLIEAMKFVARNLLFGAGATSLVPVLIAVIVLAAAGVGASLRPAMRATKIDPIQALRAD